MDDDGCMGCVMTAFVSVILIAIIGEAIDAAITPYLYIAKQILATLLVLATIGLIVYLVIGQQKSRIDTELRKVLAQVEAQEPIEVRPALGTASVAWQESVLTDSEWGGIALTFVRDTEDGEMRTTVCLEPERAIVRMVLNGSIELEHLDYSKYGRSSDSQKQSAKAIRHVREWMRRRILPELKAAKTRRESESRRLAGERDAKLDEERRKREEYRRKYLP